jgi:hypothetical protein
MLLLASKRSPRLSCFYPSLAHTRDVHGVRSPAIGQREKIRDQRAESREQRAESGERRAENGAMREGRGEGKMRSEVRSEVRAEVRAEVRTEQRAGTAGGWSIHQSLTSQHTCKIAVASRLQAWRSSCGVSQRKHSSSHSRLQTSALRCRYQCVCVCVCAMCL